MGFSIMTFINPTLGVPEDRIALGTLAALTVASQFIRHIRRGAMPAKRSR